MLTEREVDLICDSAERLVDANVAATNTFYANLFKTAPAVRPLFATDMFEQSEKLWQSIVLVVQNIETLDEINGALREMGRRHVTYGAKPEHYDVVCSVLIETLGVLMARDWTPDHKLAWEKALGYVASVMIEGANERAA